MLAICVLRSGWLASLRKSLERERERESWSSDPPGSSNCHPPQHSLIKIFLVRHDLSAYLCSLVVYWTTIQLELSILAFNLRVQLGCNLINFCRPSAPFTDNLLEKPCVCFRRVSGAYQCVVFPRERQKFRLINAADEFNRITGRR